MASIGAEHIAVVAGCFLSGTTPPDALPQAQLSSELTRPTLPGAMMSVFMITIPILVETTRQPGKLANAWRKVYLSGHVRGPAIAGATGLIYAIAAWRKHAVGEPWRVFAVAGAITATIAPYTMTIMQGTNNALSRADDLAVKGTEPAWAEVERLVVRWGRLNAIRALIPMAGGVMGLLGACGIWVF